MGYIKDAKIEMQRYYGGYCSLCKRLGITPVAYHAFTIEIYDATKKEYRYGKKQGRRGLL